MRLITRVELPIAIIITTLLLLIITAGCNKDEVEFLKDKYKEGKENTYYWSILWDFREWAIAFERYNNKYGEYPDSNSIEEIFEVLNPFHKKDTYLRKVGPWGEKYLIDSTNNQYTITCNGKDKIGTHESGGPLNGEDYSHSVTLQNGRYMQYLKISEKEIKEFEREIEDAKNKT